MIREIVIIIEEDGSQMDAQMSELEQVFSSLSHEEEVAV